MDPSIFFPANLLSYYLKKETEPVSPHSQTNIQFFSFGLHLYLIAPIMVLLPGHFLPRHLHEFCPRNRPSDNPIHKSTEKVDFQNKGSWNHQVGESLWAFK